MAADCVFCKIIDGQIPAGVVLENEHVIAIKDISPKAPVHILIIPKIHITNLSVLTDEHKEVMWEALKMARQLAEKFEVSGFNLVSNNGKSAGQRVFHQHFHFLSGRDLEEIAQGGL